MPRFTIRQGLLGVALCAIIFALVTADGCGKPFTYVESLSFSPDGTRAVASRRDCRDAGIWGKSYKVDLSRKISLIDVPARCVDRIIESQFARGGPLILELESGAAVFGNRGRTVFLLAAGSGDITPVDVASGEWGPPLPPDPVRPQSLVASADGTRMAALGEFGIGMWETVTPWRTGAFVERYRSPLWREGGISHDGNWVAFILINDSVPRVWLRSLEDPILREPMAFPLAPDHKPITAISFSPTENHLAVAIESELLITDVDHQATRTLALPDVADPSGDYRLVHYMFDGRHVVVADREAVQVMDLDSGKITARLESAASITSMACSPIENLVAIGDVGGRLTFWRPDRETSDSIELPGRWRPPWTAPATALVAYFAIVYVRHRRKSKVQVSA